MAVNGEGKGKEAVFVQTGCCGYGVVSDTERYRTASYNPPPTLYTAVHIYEMV